MKLAAAAARRHTRVATTTLACLALAGVTLVTPAHATPAPSTLPVAVPSATDGVPGITELAEKTSGLRAPGKADDVRSTLEQRSDGLDLLESTPTVREGEVAAARKPQIIRRSASLYVYNASWDTPEPQQVAGRVSVVQDFKAKKITAKVPFAATPTSSQNTFAAVYLGRWDSKSTCVWDVGFGALAHSSSASDASAQYKNGTTAGTARRSLSGSTLTVTVTGKVATETKYDCVYFVSVDAATAGDETPVGLSWSRDEDFTAEIEKHPKFDFYSSDLHAAYPGKWTKVRISIRNDGNVSAKNVKLRLSGSKLKFKKKTIKVGTIKAGKSKVVNARVKLKGKKTRTMTMKVTAKGKWTAKSKTKVGYRPHPKKLRSLSGRSFWGYYTGTGSAAIWQVRGLHFVNKKWVYVGHKTSGQLPKCSSKVKECLRYSYNRSKGTVKFGKFRGKVNSEGIKITKAPKKSDLKKLHFYPLEKPKKNARLKVKLKYTDGSGTCWSGGCSSWWRNLTLKKNGKFTWGRGSITTIGMPPFQTTHSSSGPTLKGTYKVLSKGRIRFTYTDPESGKRKREVYTIGIDANALGKHNPKYGLLIGDDPYLP